MGGGAFFLTPRWGGAFFRDLFGEGREKNHDLFGEGGGEKKSRTQICLLIYLLDLMVFNEFLKFCLFLLIFFTKTLGGGEKNSRTLWGGANKNRELFGGGRKKIERHFFPNSDYLRHIDIVNVRDTVIRVPV